MCNTIALQSGQMKSMTFRLSDKTRQRLKAKAKSLGTSESDLLRAIVEKNLQDRPMSTRLGHLKGALSLPKADSDWHSTLRKHNWRS